MPIFPWQLPTENKWDHLLVMGQNLGSILPSTARDFVLTVAGVLFQLPLGCWAGCAWNEKLRLACARSAPRRTSGVGDERTLAALADNGFPWTAGRETGRNPSMGCWGVGLASSRARTEPGSLLMLDAVTRLFLLFKHNCDSSTWIWSISPCIHCLTLASCWSVKGRTCWITVADVQLCLVKDFSRFLVFES